MTFDEWWMSRQPEHPYTDNHLRDVWNAAIQNAVLLCDEQSSIVKEEGASRDFKESK